MVWQAPEGMTDDVPGYTSPLPRPPKASRPVSRRRRILKRTAFAVAAIMALFVLAAGALLLTTPSADQATKLAEQQAVQHGIGYPGPPVPDNFVRPLVATEDHRFYSEPGIDPLAVGRAAAGKLTGGQDQGGATIAQQLAKMLYTPGQSGLAVELKQVALAVKLNAAYSKAQILRLYAEVAYYGHGYYGLQAASCGYFGHPPSQLTVSQGHAGGRRQRAEHRRPGQRPDERPRPAGARDGADGGCRLSHPGAGHPGTQRAARHRPPRPGRLLNVTN